MNTRSRLSIPRCVFTVIAAAGASSLVPAAQVQPPQPSGSFLGAGQSLEQSIKRGEYLAWAGDCVACHTKHGGQPFAGGFAMPTPFGTLYSPNITPDAEYGIGNWSADDFHNMLHNGYRRDGSFLYPVMPFPAYTRVTRADSDAIFAYLSSLAPVHDPNRENELRFPYNNRSLLLGWRTLFFREGEYRPDPKRSAEWNRGGYLVEGLGHCGTCHTAINALGGSDNDKAFAGGLIPMQNWYAPSLTNNKEAGLGDWPLEDIEDLLRAGASQRGAVYGPMAEVVHNSLQYLTDADIRAMAVYLQSLPERHEAPPPGMTRGATQVSAAVLARGHAIYAAQCKNCHLATGLGQPPGYPPLAKNQSIEMQSAVNPIRMVLNGGYPPQTATNPRPYGMPPFAQVLSDEDVAAVVTYIRVSWDNHGQPVTTAEVNMLRSAPLLD
jgi:mono/diheme cytochrome c family protein